MSGDSLLARSLLWRRTLLNLLDSDVVDSEDLLATWKILKQVIILGPSPAVGVVPHGRQVAEFPTCGLINRRWAR